jgi:hypothetical protein
MASQRTDLSVEGLRLPDLERTVACLVRGAEAAHLELVTALLRDIPDARATFQGFSPGGGASS